MKLRNDPFYIQPKRNYKRKAIVNNATDYKVPKIHTGNTKKKVANRHTTKKVPQQKKVKVLKNQTKCLAM